jgi:hypothetical protein
VVQAIVLDRADQISFGILDLFMINAQPPRERLLHNILSILFTTYQIVCDGMQERLIECYGLRLIHVVQDNKDNTFDAMEKGSSPIVRIFYNYLTLVCVSK